MLVRFGLVGGLKLVQLVNWPLNSNHAPVSFLQSVPGRLAQFDFALWRFALLSFRLPSSFTFRLLAFP
jgi:hypothetical protein